MSFDSRPLNSLAFQGLNRQPHYNSLDLLRTAAKTDAVQRRTTILNAIEDYDKMDERLYRELENFVAENISHSIQQGLDAIGKIAPKVAGETVRRFNYGLPGTPQDVEMKAYLSRESIRIKEVLDEILSREWINCHERNHTARSICQMRTVKAFNDIIKLICPRSSEYSVVKFRDNPLHILTTTPSPLVAIDVKIVSEKVTVPLPVSYRIPYETKTPREVWDGVIGRMVGKKKIVYDTITKHLVHNDVIAQTRFDLMFEVRSSHIATQTVELFKRNITSHPLTVIQKEYMNPINDLRDRLKKTLNNLLKY